MAFEHDDRNPKNSDCFLKSQQMFFLPYVTYLPVGTINLYFHCFRSNHLFVVETIFDKFCMYCNNVKQHGSINAVYVLI